MRAFRHIFPLLGLLVGFGCARTSTTPSAEFDADPSLQVMVTDEMRDVGEGSNGFAIDLYGRLKSESGNLLFSPYSAHAALAMTSFGAKGTTRDEMVRVLHLPADPEKALAAGDLNRYYAQPHKEYELSVANALWGQTGYPWRTEFLDRMRQRFGAGINEANFAASPEAERVRINDWAAEQTRDKIRDLLAPGLVTTDHRMVLVNAIYFKGRWKEQFNPRQTRELPFTLADGTKKQVPMMYRQGGFRWYNERSADTTRQLEFQVAELPYQGDELSMVILLPGKHDGISALEAKLTTTNLADWLKKSQAAHKDTELYLPKFRIETPAMMLKEPLKQLGMIAAFDRGRADLSELHSGRDRLFVDFVVQKAFVDVNEVGTEAAAATGIGIVRTSARLDFRADRPFLFLIRDVKNGTILFLGRVSDPSP
jgi:serpin B